METITKNITKERVPTTIRPDGHEALLKLQELLSREKQVGVSHTEAVTIAVIEALQKREKRGKTPTPKGN